MHLTWDGRIVVSGAEAGRVRAFAPPGDGIPDLLVTHVALRFLPDADAPPDRTALRAGGAGV